MHMINAGLFDTRLTMHAQANGRECFSKDSRSRVSEQSVVRRRSARWVRRRTLHGGLGKVWSSERAGLRLAGSGAVGRPSDPA